jgi:hypothetical protein
MNGCITIITIFMSQPGRNWSSGGYRFGYQGKTKRSFNKYKNQIILQINHAHNLNYGYTQLL